MRLVFESHFMIVSSLDILAKFMPYVHILQVIFWNPNFIVFFFLIKLIKSSRKMIHKFECKQITTFD